MRTTGMSLCRYIKETRRPRMRVASRLKHQRALAYRPRGMTGAVRACGHPVGTINSLSYRASPARRQRRRRSPNVKVVLCLIYATEPGTGRTKIGPRDRGVRVNRERAATATLWRRAKTLNPDDDRVARNACACACGRSFEHKCTHVMHVTCGATGFSFSHNMFRVCFFNVIFIFKK